MPSYIDIVVNPQAVYLDIINRSLVYVDIQHESNVTVGSVNGKTGNVVLTYSDVGAKPQNRVVTITSSSTPTPNADITDEYIITALASGATFGAPTGTPVDGQKLLYAVKDNGTSRSLALNSVFVDLTGSFPAATTIGKWTYFGARYNANASKWHIIAVITEP